MNNRESANLPIVVGDVLRLTGDILLHGLALLPPAVLFVALWRTGVTWVRLLALPAAYAALTLSFPLAVMAIGLVIPKVRPGRYCLRKREALPWIAAESLILALHRSPLRGYLEDFSIPRYLFYRLMGAKIDRTLFVGGEARILDPWALEAGRNVVIGAFAKVAGHVIQGDRLIIRPVRIGDGATVGGNASVFAGVKIGEGAVVGACSYVGVGTHIPPYEVWSGVPAKKCGEVNCRRRGREVSAGAIAATHGISEDEEVRRHIPLLQPRAEAGNAAVEATSENTATPTQASAFLEIKQ